jgi:serine/threonine protein kinase
MSTHPPTLSKPSVPSSGTDHDALPPGTRFGEFEILRVVGVGGFGIVYLAQDHSLEREVALKEYMPASLAARGAGPQITVRSSSFAETYAIGLRSFINEARLLARFDHPSLVKVYRFWEDNATAYMVMPFLQGVTLRDARRGMPHAPDEAWIRSVLTPILSALELLHREGVYHRDIAPDNILLPRDGPPVLLDFGAARRVISDRTQSLTAILKPSYAPIEQYAEMTQLRQGPWTDIYALGAVVHYLLFGAPPAPATARAVQDDGDATETRIVPGVSPRFLEAMSWMLAIRPNQRPQSGEQLRAVLDGRAEIPPRGRPGVTVPGALAPSTGTQIEQVADATRINTAYLPTHLPTARVAPGSDQRATTTFSPKAPMPTARQTPIEAPPQRPAGSPVPTATPPAATASPPARPAAAQPPATTSQRPVPAKGAAAPAATAAPVARPAVTPPAGAQAAPPTGAQVPPSPARGGQNSAPAPLAATTAAASPKRHEGPPSQPASLQRREGPTSQPATWAASRPAALPSGAAAGPHSRPPVTLPPASRPAPLAAAHAASGTGRRGAAKSWLVLAGGGAFVVVAALAAWQYSARRDPAVSEQASTASAPASSVVATPAAPAQQIIIETPDPSPTSTVANEAAKPPLPTPTATPAPASPATPADTTARAPTAGAAIPDAGAASAARARPQGKPVPRVGEDPALAGNSGIGTTRPPESPTTGSPTASTNGDRHVVPSTPAPRDYGTVQRPTPSADYGGQSIRDVCKGSFFERNICLDQRCEEARFRSTPECVDVLNRKGKRQSQ